MLKSYMTFLRNACEDVAAFDLSFYEEKQAWGMLYWSFMRQPLPAGETLEMSKMFDSTRELEWKPENGGVRIESACLRRGIDLELTCTTLHMRLQDYWAFRRC